MHQCALCVMRWSACAPPLSGGWGLILYSGLASQNRKPKGTESDYNSLVRQVMISREEGGAPVAPHNNGRRGPVDKDRQCTQGPALLDF